MQIVSDGGMDLTPEQTAGVPIHVVPLTFTLDGKTYRSGVDIQPAGFYELLNHTSSFPTTSQPSAGDFATLYHELAATDPEILSVHISSGLSGTCNAARTAAAMTPEAHVTVVDSKTLSGPLGWQVEAAARAVRANWQLERILQLLAQVGAATDGIFTLRTLRYLIHGGRISHIKALAAQILDLKPIIGVEKAHGTYVAHGQARSLPRAILQIAEHVARQHGGGTPLRVQLLDGANPEGIAQLHERMEQLFPCTWLPTVTIAPVLGAHTGPGLVGLAYAPLAAFPALP
jgi:DegV family protein with EDD domain